MEPVFRRCTTRVERRRDREEKETGWRVFLDGDSTAVHGGDSVTLYRRVVLVRFISPSFLLILSFGFWSSSVNKSAGTINTSQPDKLSRPSSQLVKANQPGQLIRFGSTRSNRVDSFNTQSTQFRLGSVHVSYVWVHVGSDSVSGLSQNMSAKVNRSKKVNAVNTRSTVGSKTVNPRPVKFKRSKLLLRYFYIVKVIRDRARPIPLAIIYVLFLALFGKTIYIR
ncbi:hypothetical protein HanPSC8_Chr03g0116111 [Helianthus annuus]|nr:hypothetical protein HanPSC8_Chr03g0116111 [Helianthus annuus]